MNLMKTLIFSTILSVTPPALAQIYTLGNITPSSSVSFDTETIYGDEDFLDYFTFNLSTDAATVFGSAPDVKVKTIGGKDATNIIAIDLFSGNSIIKDLIKADESFAFKNLSAGAYYFAVSGKHRGTLGGSYTFNFASTAASIPELASYSMLALGLLVFMRSRRKLGL